MKIALKIIIPIAILVAAFLGFKGLASLKPEPQSKQPPPVVPVVELIRVSSESHSPPILSYGTVSSYFETGLTPQVSGKITYVSPKFRVGETLGTDHLLVKIDPTDFQATLASAEADLTVAERTFAEEEIRAEQAAGDWKASGRELSKASAFVLRKPQLAAAQASIKSVKATIIKARADLDRTEVFAPFPAVVTARSAAPGNQASPQTSLGTLVSTEKVEIRLPLTASQLSRVKLPTKATLTSPLKPGVSWEAAVVRLEPTVDSQNQVIHAVAEVSAPFADGKAPLTVGIFANARIEAAAIPASYRIQEAALVKDSYFWIMNESGELVKVAVERLHSFDGNAFVRPTGVEKGELSVVSRPLSNFRNGMKVQAAQIETAVESTFSE